MIKRMLIMLILVGAVLGGLFGFKAFVGGKIKEAMAGMANLPQTVSAVKAASSDWQPRIDAVGSLRAVRGAELSLEVPGVVDEITFQSGDEVQAGQILLRLRNEDEVAKLQSLEATAQLAQITHDRDVKQLKAQAARYTDTAALFQALGGGWWNRTDVDPKSMGKPGVFALPPVQDIKLPRAGH